VAAQVETDTVVVVAGPNSETLVRWVVVVVEPLEGAEGALGMVVKFTLGAEVQRYRWIILAQ
jgi:hypothetical protein